jgi:transcriptional regulator with XRE-family HTH domain
MTGDDLKAWRTARDLTQQQVAGRLGMTANTIARWERGELQPSPMLESALRWVGVEIQIERENESRGYRRRYRARQRKRAETEMDDPPAPADESQMVPIDGARLRQLLQLVHPDKHGGSKAANDITAWLLSQVQRR